MACLDYVSRSALVIISIVEGLSTSRRRWSTFYHVKVAEFPSKGVLEIQFSFAPKEN